MRHDFCLSANYSFSTNGCIPTQICDTPKWDVRPDDTRITIARLKIGIKLGLGPTSRSLWDFANCTGVNINAIFNSSRTTTHPPPPSHPPPTVASRLHIIIMKLSNNLMRRREPAQSSEVFALWRVSSFPDKGDYLIIPLCDTLS